MSRQSDRQRRAQAVYAAAARVLCELGYEKASIRDIAEASDMTGAGLYYYFKSKEELLFIILDGYMDKLLQGMEELARQSADPEQRLRAFIRFQVDLYCRDIHRSKLIIHDENCLSGERYQIIKDKQRQYLGYWKTALADYSRRTGKPIPFLSAHAMLLTGMCNWIYQWYDPEGELKPESLADLIYERFTHGLG